jgi:nicotinate-nucleotide adenylyltransferase
MHIGLYFGSFNPIHNGHLMVAEHVVAHTEVDKVWFVVSPHNPLKDSASLLNEYDRLHLVELAIADNPKFRVSNIEFSLPKPSYTIDTLTYLAEKFPLETFSVILGGDSYANLKRWKNWEQLVARHPLIVYARPGFANESIPEAKLTFLNDAPQIHLSASYIRQEIRAGRSTRYLVQDTVRQYIEENRYYR